MKHGRSNFSPWQNETWAGQLKELGTPSHSENKKARNSKPQRNKKSSKPQQRKMDWFKLHPDSREKKDGLVAAKKRWTGCSQTKAKMDWCIQTMKTIEEENGLVSSRPSRKEKWTGCIQTTEKRKMNWLYPIPAAINNYTGIQYLQNLCWIPAARNNCTGYQYL